VDFAKLHGPSPFGLLLDLSTSQVHGRRLIMHWFIGLQS